MKRTLLVTFIMFFCISLTAEPINLKTLQQPILQLEQRVKRLEQLLTNRSAAKKTSNIHAGREAWRKLNHDEKDFLGLP